MAKYYFEKWSLKTVEVDVRAYDSRADEHVMRTNTVYKKGQPNLNTRLYDFTVTERPSSATAPKLFFYPPIATWQGGDTSEHAVLISTAEGTGPVLGVIKKLDRIKDTLVENIVADESEYPEDGIQGDYWYVRGEKAFPSLKLNGQTIGGAKIKDSVGQVRAVGNVYFKDSNGLARNLK